MKSTSLRYCVFALCIGMLAGGTALWGDPPNRVGRLNFLSGTVSFHPESVDQWAPASLNEPLTIGDNLWTDQDSQAEIHVGSTAFRLAPNTEISFLNLNDQTIQIRLSTGSLNIRLRHMGPEEQIELDTPNSSVSLLRAGTYRVDVQQSGDTTVTVRSGEAEVTAGGSVFALPQMQSASITGLDSPAYQVARAVAPDDWDNWCLARDQKENTIASAQYVPRDEMSGVEDLDQYGSWSNDPDYGPVWTPTVVVVGWAPYRFGHWAWVDPWGWTWIDDAPWGFAPFHYGRWTIRRNAWAWVPGAHIGHAVYAPALVAFVGGSGWHPSQAPGESVGWFPLGPHEPFIAPYRADRTRLHNVDVQHLTYANRSVPGAVTVVPNATFVGGQQTAGGALRLSNEEIMEAPMRGAVAPLVPQKESFLGSPVISAGTVAHPPASVMSRPVVARMTPPPPAVPFAARQKALAAHPGQPMDAGTLTNLRQAPQVVRSPVNVVSPGYQKKGSGQLSIPLQPQRAGPAMQPSGQPQARVQPGSTMRASRQPQDRVQPGSTMQPSRQPPARVQPGPSTQSSRQPPARVQPGPSMQPSRQPQPTAKSKSLLLLDPNSPQ